jgi:mannose-6-phosphate isomerase-like protein (cupin superfamily)
MKINKFTVQETLKKITVDNKERYTAILEDENIEVGLYAPVSEDMQSPHQKDEIYIIMNGEGTFYNEGQRELFGPGDLFFVNAGADHRFENFSDDLVAWYVIYGDEKDATKS